MTYEICWTGKYVSTKKNKCGACAVAEIYRPRRRVARIHAFTFPYAVDKKMIATRTAMINAGAGKTKRGVYHCQASPEKPREAQRSPEKPREVGSSLTLLRPT
jgi:hypothetical protein